MIDALHRMGRRARRARAMLRRDGEARWLQPGVRLTAGRRHDRCRAAMSSIALQCDRGRALDRCAGDEARRLRETIKVTAGRRCNTR